MATQGELFPSTANSGNPSNGGSAAPAKSDVAPVWLQRVSLIVLVLFCLYVGGLMTMLPWLRRYWTENGWLLAHPGLNAFLQQGWVRGLVSGLGLLDIWIGVSELLHYNEFREPKAALEAEKK